VTDFYKNLTNISNIKRYVLSMHYVRVCNPLCVTLQTLLWHYVI